MATGLPSHLPPTPSFSSTPLFVPCLLPSLRLSTRDLALCQRVPTGAPRVLQLWPHISCLVSLTFFAWMDFFLFLSPFVWFSLCSLCLLQTLLFSVHFCLSLFCLLCISPLFLHLLSLSLLPQHVPTPSILSTHLPYSPSAPSSLAGFPLTAPSPFLCLQSCPILYFPLTVIYIKCKLDCFLLWLKILQGTHCPQG